MSNNGTMEKILRLMAEKKASDVYISSNSPVLIKIQGNCVPINNQLLPVDAPRNLLAEILTPEQLNELDTQNELNIGIPMQGIGRFRLSAMHQRGSVAAVFRYVSGEIPELGSLSVPKILGDLIMEKHGLILMVGSTGAGKSTTLAAMINHRNHQTAGHILTIEDPIEFLFKNDKSVINQREIRTDTESLNTALRNALRQAPDVIMIGEIRDRETMSAAMAYAQSGHLCLATLHANNSYQALNRILSFYPVEVRPAMLNDLANSLRAITSQRLLRTIKGERAPAVEVLINTRLIAELIEKGDFFGVKEALEKSMAEGSQTFEQDIARLITQGIVNRTEGLANADSPNNLMWRLENDFKGNAQYPNEGTGAAGPDSPSFDGITLDKQN